MEMKPFFTLTLDAGHYTDFSGRFQILIATTIPKSEADCNQASAANKKDPLVLLCRMVLITKKYPASNAVSVKLTEKSGLAINFGNRSGEPRHLPTAKFPSSPKFRRKGAQIPLVPSRRPGVPDCCCAGTANAYGYSAQSCARKRPSPLTLTPVLLAQDGSESGAFSRGGSYAKQHCTFVHLYQKGGHKKSNKTFSGAHN